MRLLASGFGSANCLGGQQLARYQSFLSSVIKRRSLFAGISEQQQISKHPSSQPQLNTKFFRMSSGSSSKPGKGKDSQDEKPKFSVSKEELKARLSPIQYQVTQLKSTERPFTGEYNKFNKKGTYLCVVCDEELFKSDTKFESGCGWPAFFDSIDKQRLKFVQDHSLVGAADILRIAKNPNLVRIEVLCKNCDAHLGHVFDDGPISKGGKRYCINSAALRFEPNE